MVAFFPTSPNFPFLVPASSVEDSRLDLLLVNNPEYVAKLVKSPERTTSSIFPLIHNFSGKAIR